VRTIIWFIYFWGILLKLIPSLNRVKKYYQAGKIEERDRLVDQKVKEWSTSLVKLSGTRVTVSGEENIPKDTAVLFVSNHQGNFDIPILLGYPETESLYLEDRGQEDAFHRDVDGAVELFIHGP
jgi:1-acyl-sn-glycerol-3-phosphate acyltransferase